nr:Elongation of very long chain fatty acids protein [Oceanusvirus sp.]
MDPLLAGTASVAYVGAVALGVRAMKNRAEPLRLGVLPHAHNAFLAALSLYMTIEILLAAADNFGWRVGMPLSDVWCVKVEASSESGKRLARIIWIHYLSKFYEFVDTALLVAKKKRPSFLHLYHHATVAFPTWCLMFRAVPGGPAYFCAAINSAVHVVMYTYFFATGIGYRSKTVRPWITAVQIFQFVMLMSQAVHSLFAECNDDDGVPQWVKLMQLGQGMAFFGLFSDFFAGDRRRRSSIDKKE